MLLDKLLVIFSIRTLFLIFIFVSFIISAIAGALLEINYQLRLLEKEKLNEVCLLASRLQEITEFSVNKKEISFLERISSNLNIDPYILDLLLIDNNNKIVVSIKRKYLGKKLYNTNLSEEVITLLQLLKKNPKFYCNLSNDKNEIISIAPVLFPSDKKSLRPNKVGFVILVYSLLDMKSQWSKVIAFKLLGEVGILALLLSFVYYLFNKLIVERIDHIIKAATQISKGNLDVKIRLTGKDEFALIANVFNILLEKLRRLIKLDYLTGIYNRFALEKEISKRLQENPYKKNIFVFFDIDNFKDINDTFGHMIGDKLLNLFAKRLKRICKKNCIVGRLGGDEFILFLQGDFDEKKLLKEKIALLTKEYILGEFSVKISLTAGVSIKHRKKTSFYELLRESDIALYYGKKHGKDMFVIYDDEIKITEERKIKLRNLLKKAFEKNEFYLVFQPIFDVKKNKITTVEALLRWRNSEVSNISPSEFIPILEETGLIKKVGLWVIEESCKQLIKWEKRGVKLKISINIDIQQMLEDTFVISVKNILRKYKIDPRRIIFEITESEAMKFPDKVIDTMKQLRILGIDIALDDFGTGYSSLSYLKTLPVSYLKIDRIFVKNLPEDKENRMLTLTIIDLAKNFNFKAIGEGVETEEQFIYLKSIGCDKIQGFFISKPVNAEEIIEIVKTFKI